MLALCTYEVWGWSGHGHNSHRRFIKRMILSSVTSVLYSNIQFITTKVGYCNHQIGIANKWLEYSDHVVGAFSHRGIPTALLTIKDALSVTVSMTDCILYERDVNENNILNLDWRWCNDAQLATSFTTSALPLVPLLHYLSPATTAALLEPATTAALLEPATTALEDI